MPSTTTSSILLHLLLLFFALRPLSSTSTSTSTLHHRRILHQPFLPLDASPPSPPPTPSPPSPPKYPFTTSTPDNSTFFPSYPSPPSPPSPASLATFPANISSLSVPRPSKPNSTSSKLIVASVAAVIAAIAVVSLAVFLHLRKRTKTHGSASFNESKNQRSDSCSTISFNQTPNTHHIPKLQRPSQTSSEFLYLGTLVNSHAPGGGAAFNGSSASTANYSNPSNTRKLDSPELRPLPPLNMQQGSRQNLRGNAEVVSSKDDDSEEFYSPKGSINGKESSIGTGSASRRAFAAIEGKNFNGSTSDSSSTNSSSVPGSGSGSPVRSMSSSLSPANNRSPINSMPKSPDLIEIQTIAPLPPQQLSPPETRDSLLQESASPSPPSSSSPERYSRRSEVSSPRISNASNENAESPVRSNSPAKHNTTVIPTPPVVRGLVLPESASPLPSSSSSPERCLRRSEESSPRISNASDQNMESLVRSDNSIQHNTTVIPTPPEIRGLVLSESASPLPPNSSSPERYLRSEESSPKNSNVSDQNVDSPLRICSPAQHNSTIIPVAPEVFPEFASPLHPSSLSPERNLSRSEESSPRNSNVTDQNVESPVKICSPAQHNSTIIPIEPQMQALVFPEIASPLLPSSSSPERNLRRSEESSPRNSNVSDQNVEYPVRISSHARHNSTDTPTAPEMQILVIPESASPLPLCSSSPERCLRRSEESSPRNSNVSDQNVETPVRISSPAQHNSTDIPTAPEMRTWEIPVSASPVPLCSSSPERCLTRSEESSPRNSNVLDQNMESPVRIGSPAQLNSTDIPTSPEMQALVIPEPASPSPPVSLSPERYSGKNEELSPRISNAFDEDVGPAVCSPVQQNTIAIPTPPAMEDLVLSSPERYSRRSEESSPRISNASDQNVASPVRVSSPEQHKPLLPMSSSLPERYSSGSQESSPLIILNDSDRNVESPVRNGSSEQHNATFIPTPPPPPPAYPPVFVPSIPSPAPPASVMPPPPVSVPPPPPPPPPPLSKAWLSPKTPTPPAKKPTEAPSLKNPLKPIAFESPTLISPIELPSNDSQTVKNDCDKESPNKETEYSSENVDSNGESPPKPKLKPLHWDKVRASSDREMVWDQLKCSSFELNEEMIETLFVVNTPKPNPKEATRWQVLPSPGQDNGNRVLDPKKAQNIAILLKALHVTVDEVCEGLLDGNADILGTELLESLLKMAPTKEEERKLKEYKDDSPVKLGPAERFLKAVVDIPHAFGRVEAMLYISNFESEVEYLKKSFATLEAACEELRTSRMFLKLLEAVLKTGNRMNVGTNRGDAHAFKLDTLLKLVDVKGADGKTTLLHFVVQEIIRSEGARLSGENTSINDDAKCRKLGLQVVSALSSGLSNVKKAAVMDAEMLSSDVSKLSKGIGNVREIVKLNKAISLEESCSYEFSDSMNSFIEKAEEEIFRIQAQESLALSLVKEITEYFHGNSAKEEAHPFRIFMVVRDFLTILDRVCKEVGMINERTMVSSAHKFPVPVNPMLQQVSGAFHKRQYTSSDDESLPLNV